MRSSRTTFALLALLLCAVLAFGQAGETGSIIGTVTDPSGAVVPNAKVTVTRTNTGATRNATTSANGFYTFTNLQPGPYQVTIEAPGFTTEKLNIQVSVGSRNTADSKLRVAQGGTTVEVSASAEALQVNTVNQQLSETVTARQVTELPTLTRNPYTLVATAGNVSGGGDSQSTRGAGVSINGQRSASTDILLDGAENVDLFTAAVGQNVPLDSVQEFSIITSNFTAEYGRAGGGVVNVATKSGTNNFHGTAYEFNRVSALAANTYENVAQRKFAEQNGTCDASIRDKNNPASCEAVGAKGGFTRNQFGYSIGGPIVPNKLFFFSSTEWTRIRSAQTQNRLVVNPGYIATTAPAVQAFFAGVPSTLRPGAIVTGQVTDPASGVVFDNVQFSVPTDAGGGSPSNRYSSVARVDFNVTDRTQIYGRYAIEDQDLFPGTVSFSPYAGYDTGEKIRNQNALFNLTHVFSSNVVNQTKFTFNRLNDFQPLGDNPEGPTLYVRANAAANLGGTNINLPGYLPEDPGSAIPFGGPQNLYQVSNDLSWTVGRHQLRFGGQYIHARDNRVFGAFQTAVEDLDAADQTVGLQNLQTGALYDFQGAVDPQGKFPCVRNFATGDPIQTPACTLTLPVGPPRFGRNNRYNDMAFYGQDTWKVLPRLTLSLGLRWEYFGVQHNVDPRLDSNFYFGPGDTIFDRIRSGSVQIGEDSPVGGLWEPQKKNFAPRVGLAWDIFGDGRTSFRTGYGISYERNFGNVTFNVIQNPPNYAVVQIQGVPGLTVTPNNSGPLSGTGTVPLPATSLRAVDPNIDPAYSQFWSAAIERELLPNTVLSLEYSGSRGIHLYDIANINRQLAGTLILGDPDTNALTRLNPQYNAINFRGANGFSYYNGFNVGLRTANLGNTGVQFKANYTWSHAIDNLSSTFSESSNNFVLGYLDPFNPALDKGNADFDVRHRFVFSGIWDIPWLKNSNNGFLRSVLGGWEVAPIFNIRTGSPYTVWDCLNGAIETCARWMPASPVSANFDHPVSDPNTPNSFGYLDLQAAGNLDAQTLFPDMAVCTGLRYTGTCSYPPMLGRNHFYGPSNWNLDFGVYKNFKITEQFTMQFRGELYNIFNHHNYYVVTNNTDFAATCASSTPVDATHPCTPIGGFGNQLVAKKGAPFPGQTFQPTATGTDERRNVQFGLKLVF
jgi:outer membrane receptor protein involved in Fe transport